MSTEDTSGTLPSWMTAKHTEDEQALLGGTYDWAETVSAPEPEELPFDVDPDPVLVETPDLTFDASVSLVDPHDLRPHPRNREVYGDMAPPSDLLDSISQGWSPTSVLEALPDGTLIKGHLRRFAAIQLKIARVPVHYRDDLTADEAAQVSELLRDNAGRVKNREIICREWRLAFAMFKEETGSVSGEKSRDVVGKRFGVSGVTLEHGIAVVNALDSRGQDMDTREKVRKALFERGVEPAWKLRRKAQQNAQSGPSDEAESPEGDEAVSLAIQPARRHKALQDILAAIDTREPLLEPQLLAAAIPKEHLDDVLAEVQNVLGLLGNIEAEIRDRLDGARRKPHGRKKAGA